MSEVYLLIPEKYIERLEQARLELIRLVPEVAGSQMTGIMYNITHRKYEELIQ